MSLHLFKRGKYYHINDTVSWGGKSIRIRQTTNCTLRREAQEVASQLHQQALSKLRGGSTSAAVPFSLAAIEWIKLKKRGATALQNVKQLGQFFKYKAVSDITTEDWHQYVRQTLYDRRPATVNRIRATLNSILVSSSTSLHLPKQKDKGQRVRFLSVEQQEKLLSAYPDALQPLFITLCYQGLRKSEATKLEWQDINRDSATITIRDENSKSGTGRIIPMHPRVQDSLRFTNNRFVFTNIHGQPYAKEGPRKAHITACKRAGISNFTIHDWRHHWASRLVMLGASIPTLMALGGWKSERLVMRYAAVSDEHNRDTLFRL